MSDAINEWQVETADGCTWLISWLQDADCFNVQAWQFDEDDASVDRGCSCPGPTDGLFDKLETLELAMGRTIPDPTRAALEGMQVVYLLPEEDRGAWGVSYALRGVSDRDDGEIFESWAPASSKSPGSRLPPWAENSNSWRSGDG